MKQVAPIILFAYNRPLQTSKTLKALAQNQLADKSTLYIFCDGPKKNASAEDLAKIEDIKHVANNTTGFKNVIVTERTENWGLANSIIDGVTKICNKYGSVIVVEDDIVTSPFFLKYMNEALELYSDIEHVGCISGYWYPIKQQMPETFFLKNQSCWGWATWAKEWNEFEVDGSKLLAQLNAQRLEKEFDLEGSIKYTQMLKDQISGKNNSWAIRWDAVNFINNKLCLYPAVSLVQNVGFDGSGIHSGETNHYNTHLHNKAITVSLITVAENTKARKALISFYKKTNRKAYIQYLYSVISKLLFLKPTKR